MKIAIASGKGGTGKTTLSTNLASFLAEENKVVLVDLDVEEPNSGLFIDADLSDQREIFKMIPEWKDENCTLCGNCQDVCNFNAVMRMGQMILVLPELCHGCYACSELCKTNALPMVTKKMGMLRHFNKGNLHFIESRLNIGEEQAVSLIKQTIDYVDDHFNEEQIIIFDAPPGTSCPVIEATKDADYVVLVTEPTPFGLHDLKLAVKTMRTLNKAFGVVINRDGIGNNETSQYCIMEQIPVLTKIPNDRRIAELYAEGKLIYKELPQIIEHLKPIVQQFNMVLEKNVS